MKFKYTNEVYAANGPNFLDPISYGTQQVEPRFLMAQQVEPQFFMAYILTSTPVHCSYQ